MAGVRNCSLGSRILIKISNSPLPLWLGMECMTKTEIPPAFCRASRQNSMAEASAHMAHVVRRVHLHLKSIRIEEFERFLGCRVREF